MPGLRLFTSNRLEVLAEKLAELLGPPLPSPLASEIIPVQGMGMERWVSSVYLEPNAPVAQLDRATAF